MQITKLDIAILREIAETGNSRRPWAIVDMTRDKGLCIEVDKYSWGTDWKGYTLTDKGKTVLMEAN